MAVAFLGLGSNLGDRKANLHRALRRLRAQPHVRLLQQSHFYETDPVGGPPGQSAYINAVVKIQTDLSPAKLLDYLLAIESELGRVRGERNGPRTLDLDILLYDALIQDATDPIIPHPRMHERRFVLEPLAEVAPDVIHPRIGLTANQLLTRLVDVAEAIPFQKESSVLGWSGSRDLVGKRALVTGSTSGIGLAIVEELSAAGASVIVHGRRSMESAERVVARLRARGGEAAAFPADLRDADACDSLVERTWSHWDGIDFWINNAGADTLTGEAAQWSFDRKLSELWLVDVLATIRLSRAVGQRMQRGGGGVILNMGWDQAEIGMEGDSGQLFATVKGAVMAFSRSLAVELAPKVRVNCLAPGWIRTAWGEVASAVWQGRVERETPLRCWGLPEDVAQVAHWLVSPSAQFLTGQVIAINGGAVR